MLFSTFREEIPNKMPAYNGRFGASSGSPESLYEFGSFAPVRTAVEAPPASSRWDELRFIKSHRDYRSVEKCLISRSHSYWNAS